MAVDQLTAALIAQLNNLPGFPPAGATGFELGAWLDSINIRPGVASAAALPVSGNNTGDVRFALAEGAFYYWDGAAWIAVGGGGGGGVDPTAMARGFTLADYYEESTGGLMLGADNMTFAMLINPRLLITGAGQFVGGTLDSGTSSGYGFVLPAFSTPISFQSNVYDGSGALQIIVFQLETRDVYMGKLILLVQRFATSGGTTTAQFFVDGQPAFASPPTWSGPAVGITPAATPFRLGGGPGWFGEFFNNGQIHGAAYVESALTDLEIADWTAEVFQSGQIVDGAVAWDYLFNLNDQSGIPSSWAASTGAASLDLNGALTRVEQALPFL